jgi:putative ABC transport system permease protein
VDASDISRLAEISQAIDKTFDNSSAETLTETERAFQIGFVRQTEAILISIQCVSFIVILIVLAVMANTMSMAAQERLSEYSTLKALGFSPTYVAGLILTESLIVAALGGALAIALTFPAAACLVKLIDTLFPHLIVGGKTIALQAASALTVGVLAAIIPMRRAAAVRIVDGLRSVG